MGGTAKIWVRNPAAALMYNSQSINWEMLKGYYVTGLPMDLIHAAATVIFIMLVAEPMLEKLDRIKVKYGLVERQKPLHPQKRIPLWHKATEEFFTVQHAG